MPLKLMCLFLIMFYVGLPLSIKAQSQDSSNIKPKITQFIIPAAFIGYGLVSLEDKNLVRNLDLSTKNELREDHPLFAAHVDDYVQFAPALAVYGLHIAGIKGKHNLMDATGLYILAEGIMGGTVSGLKSLTHRLRPDGSSYTSFPSGHTANAFASAEFLNQEYRDVSPWYGYAGYTVATATGVLRMFNNKHWLSDVVAGAGIGILSTKVSYLIYPHLKRIVFGRRGSNFNLAPSYQQHSVAFSFYGTF